MTANRTCKFLLTVALAASLAAPALALDAEPATQMAQIGQSTSDMIPLDNSSTIVETSQMPSKASLPAPRPEMKVKVTELRPSIRQPAGTIRPLMLGIGY